MISSLRGTIIDIGLGHAVIECAGVGYLFNATPHTLAELRRGEETTVLTHMIVREDSMSLYGFTNNANRELFSTLLSVSGVGPRLALAVQSVFTATDFAQAITHGDTKAIQRVPGIGKRSAERMIVELKEKVSAFIDAPDTAARNTTGDVPNPTHPTPHDGAIKAEVIEALKGLDFNDKQANTAVDAALTTHPDADNSTLLRAALATLTK